MLPAQQNLGACHAAEIPFVFDDLASPINHPLVGAGAPQQVADSMHGAWVRFISTGDPGWAAYSPDHRTVMRFDVDSEVVDEKHEERSMHFVADRTIAAVDEKGRTTRSHFEVQELAVDGLHGVVDITTALIARPPPVARARLRTP